MLKAEHRWRRCVVETLALWREWRNPRELICEMYEQACGVMRYFRANLGPSFKIKQVGDSRCQSRASKSPALS